MRTISIEEILADPDHYACGDDCPYLSVSAKAHEILTDWLPTEGQIRRTHEIMRTYAASLSESAS